MGMTTAARTGTRMTERCTGLGAVNGPRRPTGRRRCRPGRNALGGFQWGPCNPFGNPVVVVTVPVGRRLGGRHTQLDLR